ncbi:hypothetical protein B7494_g4301 [Chlorociboria aeruginascens]|nr:hypothetical protein B7494_g4301 [Chlorociboria aeruginascens]
MHFASISMLPPLQITTVVSEKSYNYFGLVNNEMSSEATSFLSKNSDADLSDVEKVLQEFLSVAQEDCQGIEDCTATAWVTVRMTKPTSEYVMPRWHRDGRMYPSDREGQIHSKYAVTLVGAPTRVLAESAQDRYTTAYPYERRATLIARIDRNVGLIGSGIYAQEGHLPGIEANPNLTLKAIFSRTLKSAQAIAPPSVDIYSNDSGVGKTYHDLLLRPDIHAVIIALPILAQPEYIEAALAAGKHVLSEKPIAGDIQTAERLIEFSKSDKVAGNATWSVGENFRFLGAFEYAKLEIGKLGRVLGFRVKSYKNVKPGGKYFETEWRKKPEYQGGFLLDGGVHDIAGVRVMLSESAKPVALTAYTSQLQDYLPPVDTVDSIWRTASGVSGTFCASFGTSLSGSEFTVACENGSVTISPNKVTVRQGDQELGTFSERHYQDGFDDEGYGTNQELRAWADSIASGKPDARQSPEEALADLEILEKMLKSSEADGMPQKLQYQI